MWKTTYGRAHFHQKTFCCNFFQVKTLIDPSTKPPWLHSLVPSLRNAWDIISVFVPFFFITSINTQWLSTQQLVKQGRIHGRQMRPSAGLAHLYSPHPLPSPLLSPSPSPWHPLFLRSRIHAFSRIRNKSVTDGPTDSPSYRAAWTHLKIRVFFSETWE